MFQAEIILVVSFLVLMKKIKMKKKAVHHYGITFEATILTYLVKNSYDYKLARTILYEVMVMHLAKLTIYLSQNFLLKLAICFDKESSFFT